MEIQLKWGEPHVFTRYGGQWKRVEDLEKHDVFSAFCGTAFRAVKFLNRCEISNGVVRIKVVPRTLLNIEKNQRIISYESGTRVFVYNSRGVEQLIEDVKKQHGQTIWGQYSSD